jgi:hypothetical protein
VGELLPIYNGCGGMTRQTSKLSESYGASPFNKGDTAYIIADYTDCTAQFVMGKHILVGCQEAKAPAEMENKTHKTDVLNSTPFQTSRLNLACQCFCYLKPTYR